MRPENEVISVFLSNNRRASRTKKKSELENQDPGKFVPLTFREMRAELRDQPTTMTNLTDLKQKID